MKTVKMVELNRVYYPPVEQPPLKVYPRLRVLGSTRKIHADISPNTPLIFTGEGRGWKSSKFSLDFSTSVVCESPLFRNEGSCRKSTAYSGSVNDCPYVLSKFVRL